MKIYKSEYGEVTLPDMLDARERRAYQQEVLRKKHEAVIVSFTMNIAGPKKNNKEIAFAFDLGLMRIKAAFKALKTVVYEERIIREKTGCEYIAAVSGPSDIIKQKMCDIEEMDELGRLFDIDVIEKNGVKLSRAEQKSERKCLICGKSAFLCARSREHSVQLLWDKTNSIICSSRKKYYSRLFSDMALRSILTEVSVTPKPGLVDRNNSGSHEDMDFFSFVDSASVLKYYFEACFLDGYEVKKEYTDEPGTDIYNRLFEKINIRGMQAENEMLEASCGVNTHRGIIFSMGLLCAGIGVAVAEYDCFDKSAYKYAVETVKKLAFIPYERSSSQYVKEHKVEGIFAEALSAFETVRTVSLSLLFDLMEAGVSRNDSGVIVLLKLLTVSEDSNMIKRGGLERYLEIKKQIKLMLISSGLYDENDSRTLFPGLKEKVVTLKRYAEKLDDLFFTEHLSPGGTADLLALTFMFKDIIDKEDVDG